jgi:exosortase H (IPTLxxWG-CTERM-specific)
LRRAIAKTGSGGGERVDARRWPARFLIGFVATALLGYAALTAPWVKPAVIGFDRLLVRASQTLIQVCGGRAGAGGTVLRDPSSGLGVEMKDGCNGMNVTILLGSALLAFPAHWSRKLKGLLLACGTIQLVNLVRFISLFYLLKYNRAWFDFAHEYLWESLIMLDALALFWAWVHLMFRRAPTADGQA